MCPSMPCSAPNCATDAPISWWDIDMSSADWVAEARESLKRGHTSFKMKARPWRDILQQVEAVGKVVPADYKFDIDFNGFLLNQAKAEIILPAARQSPQCRHLRKSLLPLWRSHRRANSSRTRMQTRRRTLPRRLFARPRLRRLCHWRRRLRSPPAGRTRRCFQQTLLVTTGSALELPLPSPYTSALSSPTPSCPTLPATNSGNTTCSKNAST